MDADRRRALARVALLASTVLAWSGGCGRSGLPRAVPVKGRVTFAGGECPHSGFIFFVPTSDQSAGVRHSKSGSGRFDHDGQFEATTLVPGDGLLPGTYSPRIVCELPSEDDDHPGRSFVPAGFVAPQLLVKMGSGGPVSYQVDVPLTAAPGVSP